MDRLTSRSEVSGIMLVRGHGLGPAYFDTKRDYIIYCEAIDRLAAYEDTGLTPAQIKYILPRQSAEEAVERMKIERERYDEWFAWKQAESEGRLIVLPCKVGDTVYAVEPDLCDLRDKDTCDAYCDGWDFSCPDFHSGSTIRQRHFQVEDLRHFGKTVFPSHEEAAAALGGPNNG